MRFAIAIIISVLISGDAKAIDPIPELQPLEPFVGKWKTVSGTIGEADHFEQVMKWQWAFGGKIMRITHSVNKGAYYGESLINWDAQQQQIIYRYVNNAGYFADATIKPRQDGLSIHEMIRGALKGPTETISHYSVKEDGKMYASFKVKNNGTWSEESKAIYIKAPDAELVFK